MRRFVTKYPTPQGKFAFPSAGDATLTTVGMEIWANDKAEAEELAKLRNIGETIQYEDGDPPYGFIGFSHLRGIKHLATIGDNGGIANPSATLELIHEATILSYVAMKAGIADADDVLGDLGCLHIISHTGRALKYLEPLIRLEEAVPGWRTEAKAQARLEKLSAERSKELPVSGPFTFGTEQARLAGLKAMFTGFDLGVKPGEVKFFGTKLIPTPQPLNSYRGKKILKAVRDSNRDRINLRFTDGSVAVVHEMDLINSGVRIGGLRG